MLKLLFKKSIQCTHEKITPDIPSGYCPDCGEYVENQWYIARCSCCGIKRGAVIIKKQIAAESNFCKNCGSENFNIEKLEKINFIDINYAVIIKRTYSSIKQNFTQTWVEDEKIQERKLIPEFIL